MNRIIVQAAVLIAVTIYEVAAQAIGRGRAKWANIIKKSGARAD